MKKQFLLAILALCATFALGGCAVQGYTGSSSDSSQSGTVTKYKVTFTQDGQPDVVREVEAGKGLTNLPTVKQKTGYTVAWEDVDLSAINEDIIVEAVETPNEYTITYDVNGGDALQSATQTVTFDTQYTLVTPTREDWGFQGWQNGDELYTTMTGSQWKIADDVTLVAQWSDERPPVYITFEQYGRGQVTTFVKKGETLAAEKIPVPQYVKGYTFDEENWYVDKECTTVMDFSQPLKTSITVYAKKTPNTYTLSYDLNYENAPTMDALSVTYDQEYTLAANPTREGFNFLGWKAYNENGKEIQLWMPWQTEGNVTLKAQWEEIIPETYTITFYYGNSVYDTRTLNEGETLTDVPTLPTAEKGYTVTDWCTDSECTVKADFSKITAATAVYCKQVANEYTITYQVGDNATIDGEYTQKVAYGQNYQLKTPVHNINGFVFVEWLNGETAIPNQGVWEIDGNVTLSASWADHRATFTVIFMRGNSKQAEVSVKDGESIPADKIPTIEGKTGYEVDTQNWYIDAACTTVADLSKAVSKSFTVYVKEYAKTYTVTYDVAGGKLPDGTEASFTVTYGEAVVLATPTKAGYTFVGWTYTGADGKQVKVNSGDVWKVASDVKLIANWMENKEWTNNY